MSDEPPSVTEARPELPSALDAVVRRAMSKEPEERHASASELMRDAEEAFSRKTRAAMTPPGPVEGPEEIGIRSPESSVGTREARAQDSDELAAATRIGGPEATAAAVGGEATQVGDDATRVGDAGDATRVGDAGDATRVGGDGGGATVAAGAGATRLGTGPEGDTATLPPPTRAGAPRKVAPALMAVAAVVALAAAIGGFVAGNSGSSSSDVPANNSSASSGPITLTFPDTWQRSADAVKLPGYSLRNTITIGPKSAGSGTLVAGTQAAGNPSLLPDGFVKASGGSPPKPEPVKLGKLEAYRYKDLKPKGSQNAVTVYAAPTSAGVATVACSAPAAQAQAFATDCERVASTLTINGAKAYPLGVPKAYTTSLNGALTKLQSQRKAALAKLKSAKTPGSQASAARAAAGAYGAAVKALPKTVPPQVAKAQAAIAAALRAGQKGYLTLAGGAASGSKSRYGAGKRQVAKADAALKKALAQLSKQPQ
jgi:hypothetical protein